MSPNDPKDPKDYNYANRDKKNFQKFIIDGIEYKIFLLGEDTQEKYSLVEMLFPTEEEKEIPLHRHSKETVIISIIEGTFQFKYGEQNIEGKEE
ncbi:MAG: hypothetical protein ACTHKF_00860, partial [Candidatus Nitrosocosmicus sp.]